MMLVMAFACLCYSAYGSYIEDIVMLNIPVNGLTTSAKILYAVAIFASIPLFIHSAFEVIEKTQCYLKMPCQAHPNVIIHYLSL